ncbi:hypothetical protein KOI40_00535 [Aestuariicella sp. G3-2]|uniref:hypothetical protein n=1 Tax=Pseudomaricurvus albidus TaxID=2842452 RepID=UPI001C0B3565|nr:hypothetical protein [Aestuariicella albida]MBU3068279.1 hypothetical protein [Aestuariicella albida]
MSEKITFDSVVNGLRIMRIEEVDMNVSTRRTIGYCVEGYESDVFGSLSHAIAFAESLSEDEEPTSSPGMSM